MEGRGRRDRGTMAAQALEGIHTKEYREHIRLEEIKRDGWYKKNNLLPQEVHGERRTKEEEGAARPNSRQVQFDT